MDNSAPRVVFIDGIPVVVGEGGHFALLARTAPCMGYANLCCCSACTKREQSKLAAPAPIRQPWEIAA